MLTGVNAAQNGECQCEVCFVAELFFADTKLLPLSKSKFAIPEDPPIYKHTKHTLNFPI